MKGEIFLCGLTMFAFCLLIHVAIWRWRHPKHHILTLLAVLLLMPGLISLVYALICQWPFSVIDTIAIGLLHFSCVCAYIQTYPPIQDLCPSAVILLLIKKSGKRGMTFNDLMSFLESLSMLKERVQYLVEAKLVRETGGKLRIGKRGRMLVHLFLGIRRILDLPIGRG
ncbi:hypothetical protein ACFL6Y_08730 [Elusimicrobiota bacterium]